MPPTQGQLNSQAWINSQQPQQQHGGSFLSKLLPVGGAILGAALAPETGGLSLIPEIAGAALGSGAGKIGENAVEGQSILSGVPGALAEGAVGQGVGAGIGGLAGGVLGKIGRMATTAEDTAKIASDAAPYAKIPQGLREGSNLNGSLDLARNLGIGTDPASLAQGAGAVTGSNGVINGIKNQIIQQSGPVSLDPADVVGAVSDAVKNAPLVGDSAGQKAIQYFRDVTQGFNPEGSLTNTAQPEDIFNAIKGAGAIKNGIPFNAPEGPGLSSAYNAGIKALEDPLYKNAGADASAAAYQVTPEDMAAIDKATGGNQQLSQHIVDSINNATSIQDLRSAEHPFVQMSTLANAADKYAQGAVPTAGVTDPSSVLQGGLSVVAPHASILSKLGDLVGKVPPKVISSLADNGATVAKAGGAASAPAIASQVLAHAPNYADVNNGTMGGDMNSGGVMGGGFQTTGMPDSDLSKQIMLAGLYAPGELPALQQAQKAQTAQSLLGGVEGAYGGAGGGGTGNGILSAISSLIPGTQAYNYHQQEQAAAASIGQALGMSPQAVMANLPSLLAGHQGAQAQFGGLQSALSNIQSPGAMTSAQFPNSVLSAM